eukprot:TRINITY_DN2528_c0_g1_i1.p1 TRINITY_DN2528_c0_g1~~TRINITY_DN2528_c0_g1_i1.p1  ORF type:complete len:905 (+),score=167.14 TRINITY_DN2528_c0_g1_i1:134-2848(+)
MEFDGGETHDPAALTRGFSSLGSFRTDSLLPTNRSGGDEDEVIDIMTIGHHDEVATEPNTRREDDSPFSMGPDEAHFGVHPESGTTLQSLTAFEEEHRAEAAFESLEQDAFTSPADANTDSYRLTGESYANIPDSEEPQLVERENPALNSSFNLEDSTLFANMVPQSFDDNYDDSEHNVEWIGECIKEIGTRRFFEGCRVDNQEFHAYDHAEIRSRDVEDPRPAVARIIALYEQNGHKKVALEWFLRFSDVQKHIEYMRSIEVHAPTPPPAAVTPPPSQLPPTGLVSAGSSGSLSQSSYIPAPSGLASSGSFGSQDAAMLRSSDDTALMKRKRGRPPKKRHQNMEDTVEYMQRRGLSELYTTSHPTVSESSAAVLYRKCEVIFASSPTDPEVPTRFRSEGSPGFYWYKKALDLKTCALTSCKPRGLKPKNYTDALEKRYRNSDKRSAAAAASSSSLQPDAMQVDYEEDAAFRDKKRSRLEMEGSAFADGATDEIKPKIEPSEGAHQQPHEEDVSIDDSMSDPLARHVVPHHYRPLPVRATSSHNAFPGARADYVYPMLLQKMSTMEDLVQKSFNTIQSYLEETRSDLRKGVREVQKFANATNSAIFDSLREYYPSLQDMAPIPLSPSPPRSPVDPPASYETQAPLPVSSSSSHTTASTSLASTDPAPVLPKVAPAPHVSPAVSMPPAVQAAPLPSAPPPKKRKISGEKGSSSSKLASVKPKEGIQPLPSTWQAPALSLSSPVSPVAVSSTSSAVTSPIAPPVSLPIPAPIPTVPKPKKQKKALTGDEKGTPPKKKQKTHSAAVAAAASSSLTHTIQFSSTLSSPLLPSSTHSSSISEPSYSLPPSEDSNGSVHESPVMLVAPLAPPPPIPSPAPMKGTKKKRLPAPMPPNAVVSDYGTRSKKKI